MFSNSLTKIWNKINSTNFNILSQIFLNSLRIKSLILLITKNSKYQKRKSTIFTLNFNILLNKNEKVLFILSTLKIIQKYIRIRKNLLSLN